MVWPARATGSAKALVVATAIAIAVAVAWASIQPSQAADPVTVHRCLQDDGTVAFQETPCAPDSTADQDTTIDEDEAPADQPEVTTVTNESVFDSPFDEEPTAVPPSAEDSGPPSAERAACEEEVRNEIDAVDAELRELGSSVDRDAFLARLLELTAELRACKRL